MEFVKRALVSIRFDQQSAWNITCTLQERAAAATGFPSPPSPLPTPAIVRLTCTRRTEQPMGELFLLRGIAKY